MSDSSTEENGTQPEQNEGSNPKDELNQSPDGSAGQSSHYNIDSDSIAYAAIGDTVNQFNITASSEDLSILKETPFNVVDYRVSEEELTEALGTFVRTESFIQIAKSLVQNHILIIAGEEGAGKRAAAIYLAALAHKADKVAEVFEAPDKLDVDSDLFLKLHLPSIIIIEDALASESSLASDLLGEDSGSFGRLRNLLRLDDQPLGNSSYLILTIHNKNLGRLRSSKLFRILLDRKILFQHYQPPSPNDVLTKHLNYYLGKDRSKQLRNKCGDYLEAVVQELQQPYRIGKLVKNILQDIDLEQTAEQIECQIKEGRDSLLSLDNEIERFFESLDEEEKLLALNLSLLGSSGNRDSYVEHDLWHMHALISPKIDKKDEKQDDDKDDDKKNKDKELGIKWSTTPTSKRLEKIRAEVVSYPVPLGEDEQLVSHVKFKDKQYTEAILTYLKKDHPDFLLRVFSHLANLAKQHVTMINHEILDNKRHAQAILEYIKESADFQEEIISDLSKLVNHDKNCAKTIKRHVKEAHENYYKEAAKSLNNPTEGIDALLGNPETKDRQYALAILKHARKKADFREAIISDLNNRLNRFDWHTRIIVNHVSSRYPGYLQEVTYDPPSLDEDIVRRPDEVMAYVAYILGLIGYVNWPTVQQLIYQWAKSDQPRIRLIASLVLGAAQRDSETRKYTNYILRKWQDSKDENLLWTVVTAYRFIGLVDLETALNGLEKIVYCLDLSPLEFVLTMISHLNVLAEEEWRGFFLDKADVSTLDNERTAAIQYEEFLEKYFKAYEDYNKVEQVYYSILDALWILARYTSLKKVLNILSRWANDSDEKGTHTAQLTASLIGLHLADKLTKVAENEKSQNRILELISRDEEALDDFAELMSCSLIRLYPIQLAKQRKSMDVCLLLEKWAKLAEYSDALISLLRGIQTSLKDDPVVLKYFNGLFRKWQSRKMPETIRSIASQMSND